MASVEVSKPQNPASVGELHDFFWLTIERDDKREDAALEWSNDDAFCFRLSRDAAVLMLRRLTEVIG